MTQKKIKRIAEFNTIFMTLNDKGQEAALTVLQSLSFAQSVMCSSETEQANNGIQRKDFISIKK